MPDTALIKGPGKCPVCSTVVVNSVRCQWGLVPSAEYAVGDSVTWLKDDRGMIVPPFNLRKVGSNKWKWNFGDPSYLNVILFDVLFDADVFTQNLLCPNCKSKIAGAMAMVRDGRFLEVRALIDLEIDQILGSSRGKAEVVVIRDDQTYWPREDWYDHPLAYSEK